MAARSFMKLSSPTRRTPPRVRPTKRELDWRWLREAGEFSGCAFPLRRTNMRPAQTFVKRVNTIYCAFLLGQSQDVDACDTCTCIRPETMRSLRAGWWEAVFRPPPDFSGRC